MDGVAWCRVRRVATRRRGCAHASGVAARRATRWRCAHASKMPAVTAGTSTGRPAGGLPASAALRSRRRFTATRDMPLYMDCERPPSSRPRNQPRRDGACRDDRRGRARAAVGAAVDAVDTANARPARVVVPQSGRRPCRARDAARACPWTHPGRSSSRRRRRARDGKVCIDGTPRRSICFCLRNSPRIKTQVLRKLVLAGAARLPATALGARRIKLTWPLTLTVWRASCILKGLRVLC